MHRTPDSLVKSPANLSFRSPDGPPAGARNPLFRLTAAALLAFATLSALAGWTQDARPVRVVIETQFGEIEVELDAARAPVTVANFLRYVDAGYYTDGVFHRTVKLNPDNQPNNTGMTRL